jgi:hypothetical protein
MQEEVPCGLPSVNAESMELRAGVAKGRRRKTVLYLRMITPTTHGRAIRGSLATRCGWATAFSPERHLVGGREGARWRVGWRWRSTNGFPTRTLSCICVGRRGSLPQF